MGNANVVVCGGTRDISIEEGFEDDEVLRFIEDGDSVDVPINTVVPRQELALGFKKSFSDTNMKTSHSHGDQGVGIDAKNYKSKNSEANIEYWKNVNTPPPASSDDVDAVKVSNNTNIKSSPQSSLNINGAIKVSNNDKMNEATHEHGTNKRPQQ